MRPLASVPRPIWLLLAAALAGQLWWRAPAAATSPGGLRAPPPLPALQAASLGEPVALARALTLYVQAADGERPLRELDYAALVAWLERIVDLDPRGQYPLLAASQVYAAVHDQARARIMLDFTYRQFLRDPDRRWPHLAYASLAARHRLRDLVLARRYAEALRTATTPGVLPPWAAQLEVFVLEEMNEPDAARALVGAMLSSGQVRDPNEARFLARRLDALGKPPRRPLR